MVSAEMQRKPLSTTTGQVAFSRACRRVSLRIFPRGAPSEMKSGLGIDSCPLNLSKQDAFHRPEPRKGLIVRASPGSSRRRDLGAGDDLRQRLTEGRGRPPAHSMPAMAHEPRLKG